MPYDPDGDPDDFDATSLEDIDAYLADPTAQALVEDLGRAFRALPAAEQISELTTEMLAAMLRRVELARVLDAGNTGRDDPRFDLLSAIDAQVEGMGARIRELGGTPPEYP